MFQSQEQLYPKLVQLHKISNTGDQRNKQASDGSCLWTITCETTNDGGRERASNHISWSLPNLAFLIGISWDEVNDVERSLFKILCLRLHKTIPFSDADQTCNSDYAVLSCLINLKCESSWFRSFGTSWLKDDFTVIWILFSYIKKILILDQEISFLSTKQRLKPQLINLNKYL